MSPSSPAAPADRPLRRDAQRNRERILEAAAALFERQGLDVTLDEVARCAGVGVGTVYRRFPDKEELIDALLEDRVAAIVALAEEALRADDPWKGFVGFMERALALHCADRGLRQVLFSTAHGRQRVARARERIAPLVGEMLRRAQAAGALREDLESTDVPMLQFMLATASFYAGDAQPELWRRMLTITLDGLRAQRRRATPLPVGALTDEQFDRAMRSARL
jgi:AcrR family transcriptional regulator